jgi:hypothetical protein
MRHRPGIGRVVYVSTCVPWKPNENPWTYAVRAGMGVHRFGASHHIKQIINRLLDSRGRFENQATLVVYMALRLLKHWLSESTSCDHTHRHDYKKGLPEKEAVSGSRFLVKSFEHDVVS